MKTLIIKILACVVVVSLAVITVIAVSTSNEDETLKEPVEGTSTATESEEATTEETTVTEESEEETTEETVTTNKDKITDEITTTTAETEIEDLSSVLNWKNWDRYFSKLDREPTDAEWDAYFASIDEVPEGVNMTLEEYRKALDWRNHQQLPPDNVPYEPVS